MINDYQEERECAYKGEKYLVRDNGAVFRLRKEGASLRKLDEKWTFGVKNNQNGYMYFSGHRIHIIVAIAFWGLRDSKIYVVDHIDTNRCNNRVENLRWLTRLENVLLNENTYNKILYLCGGDINKFIDDPAILRDLADKNPNYSWMRTVTKEEARNAIENIRNLQKRKPLERPADNKEKTKNNPEGMGWIFRSPSYIGGAYEGYSKPEYTKALYPENVLQKDWSTPTEFFCCPKQVENNALDCYANNLSEGVQFSKNKYCESYVLKYGMTKDGTGLIILCKLIDSAKDYALTKVSYVQKQFVHENLGSFFDEKGGEKYFTLACGDEWTGGDCVDDYC